MKLLYGKPVADKILAHLKDEISLSAQKPGLAVMLVGDDKASHIYVDLKEKRAHEIGMNFFRYDLEENVSQDEILERIEKLNHDTMVHGIIVQLPLPKGFNTEKIINAIDPKKDADGFLTSNDSILQPVFPRAIVKLMQSAGMELDGKKAVVIANSQQFGQVMSKVLEGENLKPQVVLAENLLSNLGEIKDADVVISAVGSPGLLKGEMFKDGAIVIDGGIEKVGENVLGDVDFGSTKALEGFISPVPGGVGPLTIACLLENTFMAFKAQQG